MRVANKSSAELEDRVIRLRKELTEAGFDAGAQTIHYHVRIIDRDGALLRDFDLASDRDYQPQDLG
ncbi:MAG: hypothetical protein ABR575_10025 [Actinomycetota bacterium]